MEEHFDLIVLGTGVAGSTVARRCRAAGWRVAIVDCRPFGGTCALRGCTPKKIYVQAANLLDRVRRMSERGLAGELALEWPSLVDFKEEFTVPVPRRRQAEYAEAGIVAYEGTARFVGPTSVAVNGDLLHGRSVLVATGSRPAPLGIPGEEFLTTSDRFLELHALPTQIAFVGGGYISFEFAHAAVRAGCRCSILHQDHRPLSAFDPDLVARLVEASRALGIEVVLDAPVQAIAKQEGRLRLCTDRDGSPHWQDADLVVHGASRTPNADSLDLEAAGVRADKKGIEVNEFLQSVTNPAVYAAGDVAGTGEPQLTPVANRHAEVVATNLLEGNRARHTPEIPPAAVFTTPTLSRVGALADELREAERPFRVLQGNLDDWLHYRQLGSPPSAFKILVDPEGDTILGAHFLGPHAEHLVNVFAVAMRAGLTTAALGEMLFAYPTGASDIARMLVSDSDG